MQVECFLHIRLMLVFLQTQFDVLCAHQLNLQKSLVSQTLWRVNYETARQKLFVKRKKLNKIKSTTLQLVFIIACGNDFLLIHCIQSLVWFLKRKGSP